MKIKANLPTLMEIFMKENGRTIRLLDTEPISIPMEQSMKASGRMTINMERAFRLG
jgi:hypothetical protein